MGVVVQPEVLLLDDDDDLLASLAELIELACRRESLSAHSLDELRHQRRAALGCKLAILDINLGSDQPSGIDAYLWLKQQGFAERAVFLTGHAASHHLVVEAHRLAGVEVLQKPIELSQLRALVTGH